MPREQGELHFPVDPGDYAFYYRKTGDPLADLRKLFDNMLYALIGDGKVDSLQKTRDFLAMYNAFSEKFYEAAGYQVGSTLLSERYNIQQRLLKRVLRPNAFIDLVPWIKTDFKEYDIAITKPGYEAGTDKIRGEFSYHIGYGFMNLGEQERSLVPCIFESLSYRRQSTQELDPRIALYQVTTTSDIEGLPPVIQWIDINGLASNPSSSTAKASYFPDGTSNICTVGRCGSEYAKPYRELLASAGFPNQGELPKQIDFQQTWNSFLQNAGSLQFVDPKQYYQQPAI